MRTFVRVCSRVALPLPRCPRSLALAPALTAGQAAAAAKAVEAADAGGAHREAPAIYKAKFDTSKGVFVIEVHRDWAPIGADRFYNLVKNGFYDGVRFFRVDPELHGAVRHQRQPGGRRRAWNKRRPQGRSASSRATSAAFVTFAHDGPPDTAARRCSSTTRTTRSSTRRASSPFGEVVEGMDVVDKLNAEYGSAPQNAQGRISAEGNKYLIAQFPKLDYVKTATIVK